MDRRSKNSKHTILVVGPVGSTGGMASAMRAQINGTLKSRFQVIPFDNSKRTTDYAGGLPIAARQSAISSYKSIGSCSLPLPSSCSLALAECS